MKLKFRFYFALFTALAIGSTMSSAQSGDAIYKSNCQSCHGATGTPSAGMAKMMGIKPLAGYKSTLKEQIDAVKNGKGKMKPFAGKLTDEQIKAVVEYVRTLK